MKKLHVMLAALVAAMFQTGCKQDEAEYAQVPAVPLIQQALESQVPLFDGKPHTRLMELVCSYVAGDVTKEQFAAFFIAHNVDIKKLAQKDQGFQFLSKNDMTGFARGCAAYVVTRFSSWPVFALSEEDSAGDETKLAARLTQLTPVTLDVSRLVQKLALATAGESFGSEEDYKRAVIHKLNDFSVSFVKAVMHNRTDTETFNMGGKQGGYSYTFTNNSITLYLYGAPWFGSGYAEGERYSVKLKAPK